MLLPMPSQIKQETQSNIPINTPLLVMKKSEFRSLIQDFAIVTVFILETYGIPTLSIQTAQDMRQQVLSHMLARLSPNLRLEIKLLLTHRDLCVKIVIIARAEIIISAVALQVSMMTDIMEDIPLIFNYQKEWFSIFLKVIIKYNLYFQDSMKKLDHHCYVLVLLSMPQSIDSIDLILNVRLLEQEDQDIQQSNLQPKWEWKLLPLVPVMLGKPNSNHLELPRFHTLLIQRIQIKKKDNMIQLSTPFILKMNKFSRLIKDLLLPMEIMFKLVLLQPLLTLDWIMLI